jgi:hypothetical protein
MDCAEPLVPMISNPDFVVSRWMTILGNFLQESSPISVLQSLVTTGNLTKVEGTLSSSLAALEMT